MVCIDAVSTFNKLKLAHCVSVAGYGLEPLRGSTAWRRIDLSLVGRFESPDTEGEAMLSELWMRLLMGSQTMNVIPLWLLAR